jgi:hypothetical protein
MAWPRQALLRMRESGLLSPERIIAATYLDSATLLATSVDSFPD